MNPQDFYKQMFFIRTVENKLLELFSRGEIKGTVHTAMGQEACAAGVINAIDKDRDIVFSNHRAHGHIIVYGVPVKKLMAEIMGKASGLSRGIGGTQHLHWKNFHSSGIQGGLVPIAVGAAMAEKLKKNKAVVLVFLGDGTMGQGTVYEGFNLASNWKLPVLFILENNKFAQTTPYELVHGGKLEDRAKPFNILSQVVDGNDVEKLYAQTSEIVDLVREKSEPYFLVLDTYRLGPHSKGDDTRTEEEIESHRENEPLLRLGKKIDDKVKKEIEQKIIDKVNKIADEILPEPSLSFEDFMG